VALVALVVGALAAGLVWHATRLVPIDAWVMHWQERVHAHGDRVAETVAGILPVAATVIVVVDAVVAWLAGRRDAVLLALTAAPATLAAELLLKALVHRQWHGDPDLLFPSGHAAVATAVAMTTVLVLRVVPVAPPAVVAAAWLGGGFVLLFAVARLVETVHSLTDIVGGVSTGLVVTLGGALAITAWSRRAHARASSKGAVEVDGGAAPGGQSWS
jgi:membrane-associated phospholipid phosphatase